MLCCGRFTLGRCSFFTLHSCLTLGCCDALLFCEALLLCDALTLALLIYCEEGKPPDMTAVVKKRRLDIARNLKFGMPYLVESGAPDIKRIPDHLAPPDTAKQREIYRRKRRKAKQRSSRRQKAMRLAKGASSSSANPEASQRQPMRDAASDSSNSECEPFDTDSGDSA